ncbi:MAG: hypothetical protein ABW131_05370 [Candidatus Sedimenticola sp. 6PFRAG5]
MNKELLAVRSKGGFMFGLFKKNNTSEMFKDGDWKVLQGDRDGNSIIGRSILILFGLIACLAAGAQESEFEFPAGTQITFLTQDATPGAWDHSGCCGYALEPLEEFVRDHHSGSFVQYDLGRLIRQGVPPYYVFNKRYCDPIGEVLGANLFVMTQVKLLNMGAPIDRWKFDVRAKAYSSISGRERPILEADSVSIEETQARVNQELNSLLQTLREVAETDG